MSTSVLVSVLHNLACLEHRHLLSQHCAIDLPPVLRLQHITYHKLHKLLQHSLACIFGAQRFHSHAQCNPSILLYITTQPTSSDSATVCESSSDCPVTWCHPRTHDSKPSTSTSPVTRLIYFESPATVAPAEVHRMSYSGFVLLRRNLSTGLALSAETSFSGVS